MGTRDLLVGDVISRKVTLENQQDAVFIGSDCIDSYADALSAVLSDCSLIAL